MGTVAHSPNNRVPLFSSTTWHPTHAIQNTDCCTLDDHECHLRFWPTSMCSTHKLSSVWAGPYTPTLVLLVQSPRAASSEWFRTSKGQPKVSNHRSRITSRKHTNSGIGDAALSLTIVGMHWFLQRPGKTFDDEFFHQVEPPLSDLDFATSKYDLLEHGRKRYFGRHQVGKRTCTMFVDFQRIRWEREDGLDDEFALDTTVHSGELLIEQCEFFLRQNLTSRSVTPTTSSCEKHWVRLAADMAKYCLTQKRRENSQRVDKVVTLELECISFELKSAWHRVPISFNKWDERCKLGSEGAACCAQGGYGAACCSPGQASDGISNEAILHA